LHTLSTIGFGRSGPVLGRDSVQIHVVNPPGNNAVIASPPSGSGASATIRVTVAAPPNVQRVNLYVDGNLYASAPPFSFEVDTSKLSNGPHKISLRSYNASTKQTTSDEIVINTLN
jgi:hypothetical protein